MGTTTSNMKESYDVVIVGAGPAGALTAKALSNRGLSSVIIEKCSLPRDKMCSGILFPSGVKFVRENFSDMPEKIFCAPRKVKGNSLYMAKDSLPMEVPFSVFDPGEDLEKYGFNVSRAEFDFWLCNQSDASLIGDCVFFDYYEVGEDIMVDVKYAGRHFKIRTKYLVGADGGQSRVRRAVSADFDKSVTWLPAYEEWYKGTIELEPGWLYFFCDREFTDFFATVFHKDKVIHVTTTVRQGKSSKEYLRRLAQHLKSNHSLIVNKTLLTRGIMNNDMPGRKNYLYGKGNVILAGEASGIIRGGEGITSSMIIGKAAGESILKSKESGQTALECFTKHESLEIEKAHCEKVIGELETALGFNWYARE